MRGSLRLRTSKIRSKVVSALAYYPIGFYLGFVLLIVSGFLYWAQVDLGWKFDWVQLVRWISNHVTEILIVFSALLGLILIGSAIAYKQVIDLSKQDYVLWLHQKATRVLFPVFSPLHDWIRLRSRFYHWWHAQSYSNVTHYFLLVLVAAGLAKTTINYISSAQASHGCSGTTTITSNTTWSTNQCLGDVIIRNGATLTINGGVTADLSSLSVGSDSPAENGFITAKGDTLNNLGVVLNVDGTVYVRASSSINADAQGYLGGRAGDYNGKGPGGGEGRGVSDGLSAGAGHGGNGANGDTGIDGGVAYGNLTSPDDLGSGGGFSTGCCSNNGGDGGGAVKINAPSSTVTINGTISANGGNGGAGCCVYAGGGSGGSIWVIASTLSGSGTVRVNGGAGGSGGTGDGNNGGAGAGGRIQLTFTTDSSAITKQAFDGGNNAASRRAAAGTISTSNELIIANNTSPTHVPIYTTPLSGTLSYTNTTFKDYVYVTLASGASHAGGTTLIQNNTKTTLLADDTTWSGGSLTVQTGTNTINIPKNITTVPAFSSITVGTGTLQHDSHTTTDTYRLNFASSGNVTVTGTISVDAKGYGGGTSGSMAGNGTGGGEANGGTNSGGGGGYGGYGGTPNAQNDGGTYYGSLTQPYDLGSGGGYATGCCGSNGGAGGGAVKISAPTATVTVNGTITANGGNGTGGCCAYGGAGSGGSVWIITSTLSGSGTIRANGGTGGCDTFACAAGGAGAGGRVQVTYTTDSSSITTQAFGGFAGNSINARGAAGTISTTGKLKIANDSSNVAIVSPQTWLSGTLSYPVSEFKDAAHVVLDTGTNLSSGATTVQNNTIFTLNSSSTNVVWTGTTLTVQTGTNYISVPPATVAPPTFTGTISISNTLTHWWGGTTHYYSLILSTSGDINISSGANVDVSGKGYNGGGQGGNGVGTGAGQTPASNGNGGGAGHGGNGAANSTAGSGAAGGAYGSISNPTTLGSGGGGGKSGSCCVGVGGAGGGVVLLTAGGTTTVTGNIFADGFAGGSDCCAHGGGGSGGSINITTGILAGSGTIRANGGVGGCYSFGCSPGGAGAGGRVKIGFTTDSSTVTKQAFGPPSGNPATNNRGAAGTIVYGTTLIVANDSSSTTTAAITPLTDSSYSYTSFTLKDYSRLTIADNTTFTGGTTTIQNTSRIALLGDNSVWTGTTLSVATGTNGITVPPGIISKPYFSGNISISNTLNHADNGSTHVYSLILRSAGNITVESGATIDLDGLGYWGGWLSTAGSGPGGGATAVSSGAGGGHGGAGGNASSGALGGAANGDAINPTSLGSGGGGDSDAFAGDGGGAVELAAAGTLTVTGTVRVNAYNSGGAGSGGGAGGSIKLVAGTLAGNGVLQANGGNGSSGGGCGGGGRLARHYNSSSFSGTVSVTKGTGNGTCGDGTNQTVTAVTNLLVSGHASPVTAGSQGSVTVIARDSSNNQNQSFTGTVSFTSSDSQAVLPSNYAFTITDAGTKSFTNQVTLKTAGSQSITATQVGSPSVNGSQAGIVVNPAATSVLMVSAISDPVTAGTASNVTVTAKDAYSNTTTGYTGTVTFTSNDTQAVLPNNYTFVGGDAGVKTFNNGVTLKTAGERSVTATDTVTPSITGSQNNITVNTAAINGFNFTGITTPTSAGVNHSPVVTAIDAYNNTVTSYGGTIAFSSTDTAATLPTNYTFVGGDAGTHTFTNGVKFKTSGTQSLTVSNGTQSQTISNISVASAAPNKLKINNVNSPVAAGSPTSATVTVQDEFSNTVVGYTGTIAFSSSDATATLPANYTYTPGDSGIHIFTDDITFATAGTQSVTATDTVNSNVTGTLSGITVTAAAMTNNSGNSNSNGNGNSNGNVPPAPIVPTALTIVLIEPSQGTFFGTVEQDVNGLPLVVSVSGIITGNQLNGSVSGTYDGNPVAGSITGTIKGRDIESAIITLFSSTDPLFNLSVVVGGTIKTPDKPKTEPVCKLRGSLELTIDGKLFKGDVQMAVNSDGTITGSAKGFLDNDRVFGNFTATNIEGRIIDGQVTLITQSGKKTPNSGEIIGAVKEGEIVLSNAENCKFKTSIIIDIDGDGEGDGEGTGSVVIDDPANEDDPVTGPITGTIKADTPKEDAVVFGTFETLVSDIVIKPSNIELKTVEQNDLISGAAVVVSGLTLLPVLPAVQNILLTSSTRGITFIHWFFFGYTPRKRRKFWGLIKDAITGVPAAGVLVRLLNASTGEVVRQFRTDRTGRYGFLVDAPGHYQISIADPLYHSFQTKEISIDNLSQPVITGDIMLTPIKEKQARLFKKTQLLVALIKVFNIIHWPLLVGGTILSVTLLLQHATTLRSLIVSLYAVLWLSKLLGYRRERHFGQVTDIDGTPLVRAVIQLTTNSDDTTTHVHSTVTDNMGRFVMLVKPGVYDMVVAKDGFKTRHGAIIADDANVVIKLDRE